MGVALALFSNGTMLSLFYPLSSLFPDRVPSCFFEDYVTNPVRFGGSWSKPTLLLVPFFSTVIIGPLLEELVFRGCAFNSWNLRWGFSRAAFLSSCFFAVIHGVVLALPAFVFSLVICQAYRETESLIIPISAHCVHNALTITLAVGLSMGDLSTATELSALYRSLWPFGLFGALVGGSWAFWWLSRHWKLEAGSEPII